MRALIAGAHWARQPPHTACLAPAACRGLLAGLQVPWCKASECGKERGVLPALHARFWPLGMQPRPVTNTSAALASLPRQHFIFKGCLRRLRQKNQAPRQSRRQEDHSSVVPGTSQKSAGRSAGWSTHQKISPEMQSQGKKSLQLGYICSDILLIA